VSLACSSFGGLADVTGATASPTSRLINVRIGLHDRFSRLVFDLNGRTRHSLTVAANGQEITVTLRDTGYDESLPHSINIPASSLVKEIFLKRRAASQTVVQVALKERCLVRDFKLDSPYKVVLDIFPDNEKSLHLQRSSPESTANEMISEAGASQFKNATTPPALNYGDTTRTEIGHEPSVAAPPQIVTMPPQSNNGAMDHTIRLPALPPGQRTKSDPGRRSSAMMPVKTLVLVVLVTTLVVNTLLVAGFKLSRKMLPARRGRGNRKREMAKESAPDKLSFAGHLLSSYVATENDLDKEQRAEGGGQRAEGREQRAGHELPATSFQQLAISDQLSAISDQRSAISDQPLNHQEGASPVFWGDSDPLEITTPVNDRYPEALRLARQNWNIRAIAQKLQLGQDEVRLLVELGKGREESPGSGNARLRLVYAD
jgi:hypothetical protein